MEGVLEDRMGWREAGGVGRFQSEEEGVVSGGGGGGRAAPFASLASCMPHVLDGRGLEAGETVLGFMGLPVVAHSV